MIRSVNETGKTKARSDGGRASALAIPTDRRKSSTKGRLASGEDRVARIKVDVPKYASVTLRLVGRTPLLSHRKPIEIYDDPMEQATESQKAIGSKQSQPRRAKKRRDFQAEFLASLYPLPAGKGYGFPATAILRGMADAASIFGYASRPLLYATLGVEGGELLPIKGDPPTMRVDSAVNRFKQAAITVIRGEFKKWELLVTFTYNTAFWSASDVVNLLAEVGNSLGLGAWRRQKGGQCGLFDVKGVDQR